MAEQAKLLARTSYKSATTASVIFILSGLLIGYLLTFLVSSRIAKPVNGVVDMLKDIAEGEGDLTKRLVVNSSDEVGILSQWFNTFVGKIHTIIGQVKDSTITVSGSSEMISSSSEEMASGAEEQQSQTSEIATSIEEMTATILDSSRDADAALVSAKKAVEVAVSVVRWFNRQLSEWDEFQIPSDHQPVR